MSIISRETLFKEKLENVQDGKLVLELLKLGEEWGYEGCIDKFSLIAQKYIGELLLQKETYKTEYVYVYIMNVCYIVELYIKGYYNREKYIGYEEFLNIVSSGKTDELLDVAKEKFMCHINRLYKKLNKCKKRIPRHNIFYEDTREYILELERDVSICERYPITSANLWQFSFGRYHGSCGTTLVNKSVGFINLEKAIYSLYNELYIISKLEPQYVNDIIKRYILSVGVKIPFNLFEKVMNNYLFATAYSDNPETLEISKVEAELLVREIKMGTLTAEELINQLIDRYKFEGYKVEFLKEYTEYLQKRIDNLKNSNYFAELFIVTPLE